MVEDGSVLCKTCGLRICADRLDESEALLASRRARYTPARLNTLIVRRQEVIDSDPLFWAYVSVPQEVDANATRPYEKCVIELCDCFQDAFEHIWHQNGDVHIPAHELLREIVHSDVQMSHLGVIDTIQNMTLK